MSIKQTTPITVPKGEEREQRDLGCDTFRCVGTNPNGNIQWLSLQCDVYRRLLQAHMDIPYVAKERSVLTLLEVQERS